MIAKINTQTNKPPTRHKSVRWICSCELLMGYEDFMVKSFGQFAGVLDYSKMSLGKRILAKGIFAILGVKEGDYRDWNSIKEWAK